MKMLKILWPVESLGVILLGVTTMEDLYLKLLVGLCGLISLILSITFGGFLKHLHQHNETMKEMRTKDECEAMHTSSIKIFEAKLDSLHTCIETVEKLILNGGNKSAVEIGQKTDSPQ